MRGVVAANATEACKNARRELLVGSMVKTACLVELAVGGMDNGGREIPI
jgi:hypothetical protein